MTGFTFFQNYFEAINDEDNGLSEEEQGRLYNAIFAYMFRDEEPNLKGACKMAFSLIKPSLDLSKVRSNAKNKNQNAVEEKQTEIKKESNEIKPQSETIKKESNEIKSDSSPFFENKEIEEEKEDILSIHHPSRASEDAEEQVEGYLEFMRAHPNVCNDLTNPSLMGSVDYGILSEKISESNYLQLNGTSLDWLIRNYRKIVRDHYKTHKPPVSPNNVTPPKSSVDLWSEVVKARERALEYRGDYPLYWRMDENANSEMNELYKALSPEIQAIYSPTAFLEECKRTEDDFKKYDRGVFISDLRELRRNKTQGGNHG